MKIDQHKSGQMTEMAAMPISGKYSFKISSRNHCADFDESLYEALET